MRTVLCIYFASRLNCGLLPVRILFCYAWTVGQREGEREREREREREKRERERERERERDDRMYDVKKM